MNEDKWLYHEMLLKEIHFINEELKKMQETDAKQ